MKTISQKHVTHINSEELPYMIKVDLLGEDYDDIDFNEIYDDKTLHINEPIKIDSLRNLLNELEEKGANYVAIDYHTDHQEYELDGVRIELASEQEIKEREEKEKNIQMNHLKEKINSLSIDLARFKSKLKELTGEE